MRASWMPANSFQEVWWNKSSGLTAEGSNSVFYYHVVRLHLAEWRNVNNQIHSGGSGTSGVAPTDVDHKNRTCQAGISNPSDAARWGAFLENWKALYQKTLLSDVGDAAFDRSERLECWHILFYEAKHKFKLWINISGFWLWQGSSKCHVTEGSSF